ncbi:alpha/beta hydrolase fold domain-containing protein [Nostoc sp. KVJ3]|uniref:alpha/beta hydrolase n=1 Tax=Nostoc sp. KVJ3 TaxID=457945 RepID=UPI002237DFBB|nr:alpha/beta hydrolase [Nostoc sp. KVJ3]MCW5312949.1 alpha/beta hydrolase fold domain-containing protein [Nostoc sp. KVJ3]
MRKVLGNLLSIKKWKFLIIYLISIFLITQVFSSIATAVNPRINYTIERNITYHTVNNNQLKLNFYQNKKSGMRPILIVIHGGGWIKGSKDDGDEPFFAPYFDWGFSVVNIDYRLASTALAPAAVEDSICALRWVIRNAVKYKFDTKKIVLTGFSAGGHLALTAGTIPNVTKFDRLCPGNEPLKVATIINWSGITDVNDLLIGSHQKYFALQWFGNQITSQKLELAKSISPINFVRHGLPPILTIHGEKDTFVPYSQATRFHQVLDNAGVINQLYTVRGAEHGGYSKVQKREIYTAIKIFLKRQ